MYVVWIEDTMGGLQPQLWYDNTGWLKMMKNTRGNFTFPSYMGDRVKHRLLVRPEDEGMKFEELIEKYPPE